MNDLIEFKLQREENCRHLEALEKRDNLGIDFLTQTCRYKYSYNFDWLGLPIIQFPQDMIAIQEIIWKTKPDVIIETGVARGGSLVLSASILQLLNGNGKVIGIDIDIREHNRLAIESHPLNHRIKLIQGSSVDEKVFSHVKSHLSLNDKVMVILDSNHTHSHVLKELDMYGSLVTQGCYLVVMDTVIEDMPDDFFPDRPWGKNNNPKTAVKEYLQSNPRFEIDVSISNKLLITVAPDGYLKCIK